MTVRLPAGAELPWPEHVDALRRAFVNAATLATLDARHQLDDDGHACYCGATFPCATRRLLDQEEQ